MQSRIFSEGDFDQQVEVTTEDEIGEVARCFNKMVGDIKKLIDENYVITLSEKESELAALQAQINPHFSVQYAGFFVLAGNGSRKR